MTCSGCRKLGVRHVQRPGAGRVSTQQISHSDGIVKGDARRALRHAIDQCKLCPGHEYPCPKRCQLLHQTALADKRHEIDGMTQAVRHFAAGKQVRHGLGEHAGVEAIGTHRGKNVDGHRRTEVIAGQPQRGSDPATPAVAPAVIDEHGPVKLRMRAHCATLPRS